MVFCFPFSVFGRKCNVLGGHCPPEITGFYEWRAVPALQLAAGCVLRTISRSQAQLGNERAMVAQAFQPVQTQAKHS